MTDKQTEYTCVFCGLVILPYYVSRRPMHYVAVGVYGCDECIKQRHPKPSEAPVALDRAEQAGMELLEATV